MTAKVQRGLLPYLWTMLWIPLVLGCYFGKILDTKLASNSRKLESSVVFL